MLEVSYTRDFYPSNGSSATRILATAAKAISLFVEHEVVSPPPNVIAYRRYIVKRKKKLSFKLNLFTGEFFSIIIVNPLYALVTLSGPMRKKREKNVVVNTRPKNANDILRI